VKQELFAERGEAETQPHSQGSCGWMNLVLSVRHCYLVPVTDVAAPSPQRLDCAESKQMPILARRSHNHYALVLRVATGRLGSRCSQTVTSRFPP